MAYIDRRKNFRGRKAQLGSLIITKDHRLAFFIAYCDCGCNAKIGLSPDESRKFAKKFYREHEHKLKKIVASPSRALRHARDVLHEANKLAMSRSEERFL